MISTKKFVLQTRHFLNFKIAIICLLVSVFLSLVGCGKVNELVLSGSIESTQIDANSEASGKVISLDKDEGSLVKKGDILASIDSANQALAVKQQESVVKLKTAKLDELKAGTRSEQIKQAEAAVETSKTGVNSSKTSVDNAQINYSYWLDKLNKAKTLRNSNVLSETELLDAEYKVDTASQQLLSAQKQLASSQSQLQSTQAQLDLLKNGSTSQTIQAAQADLEQSQAALDQAKLLLSKFQIKTPIDGTYLLKNVNIGDMVNPGTSVATISDLTDLWVKLYIPQKNLDLVKLNQDLKLNTASGKTVSGRIIFISSESEFTPKNTETSEAKENTVYRIKVKVMDNIDTLRPGMTLEAHIPLGGK